MPEGENAIVSVSTEKKKRRRRKKGKKQRADTNNSTPSSTTNVANSSDKTTQDTSNSSKTKKQKQRSRLDRCFGYFSCKNCRNRWTSAYVFTRAGTNKVMFKQRCKNCDCEGAWVFPYHFELIKCSRCQSDVCECKCDECHKLFRVRYKDIEDPATGKKTREENPDFEYCDCDKRKKGRFGSHANSKKPHLSHLCQKCLLGYSCTAARSESDEAPQDNEP